MANRTYIQLFKMVVQEDKLRIGPRNVLHHQVMAEVAIVKDWPTEKMLDLLHFFSLDNL